MRIRLLAMMLGMAGVAAGQARQAVEGTPATTRPATTKPFVIARDTTFFTEPVRADGTIDYVEAINARLSQGVTRENNAAILLIEAVTRGGRGQEGHYARVRERLGVAAARPAGAIMNPIDGPAPVGFDQATSGPWTAEKLPEVAKWLEGWNPRLDLAVEASGKERYYLPLIREKPEDSVIAVLLPHLNGMRGLVNGLRVRAMLRLGSDDAEAFRRDAVAVVRIGRLTSHGSTLVERLVAIGCEVAGLESIRTAAAGGWLSAAQVEQMLADLRAAGSARVFETFDLAERTFLLEFLQVAAVRGVAEASKMLGQMAGTAQARNQAGPPPPAAADPGAKDWNAAMRKANGWYDRLAAAGRQPTYRERARAGDVIMREVVELKVRIEGWRGVFAPIEDRMIALALPSVGRALATEGRLDADRALTEAALALSAFRAKAGEYPATLKELVPGYFKVEPVDPFTDRPLEYRAEAGGYVLRSVGENGRVDDGPKADDRVVRAER